MAVQIINVDGMTCGGCVKSVTRLLENLEGVTKVEVSLENKTATVEFNPEKIDVNALVEAIEDGGYDASVQ